MKVEVFEDSAGQHRWRIVAGNGEIVAQSEGYASAGNAKRAIWSLLEQLAQAELLHKRIEIVEVER